MSLAAYAWLVILGVGAVLVAFTLFVSYIAGVMLDHEESKRDHLDRITRMGDR